MRIADRAIGRDEAVYVIAEIGVNHDGSSERAVELVHAAADSGADAVKFQYFQPDLLLSRAVRLARYQADAGEADPREMLARLALPLEALAAAAGHARLRGLHAIVTVFSVELVASAAQIEWDAFKTASPDLIHRPLIEALMATGRPLILSTGAGTREEVVRTRGWLGSSGGRSAFLHCVSSYPAPRGSLGMIADVARATGCPAGYSDHTPDVRTGADAVVHGAVVLEKHLTHDRAAAGPDHAASLDPEQFREYVALARLSSPRRTRGREQPVVQKALLDCEREVRAVSRQSIVPRFDIRAGEVIRRENLTFKRPGTGVAPWRVSEVVGRAAPVALEADVPIPREVLSRMGKHTQVGDRRRAG